MLDEQTRNLLKLGREAYRKKEYSRAESYLTKVLEKAESFADVHNMLGVIFHDRGLFSKAQHHFERALAINSGYTEAALNLAVTYNDLGRYNDAKEVFNQALSAARVPPGELDPYVRGKIANMYAEIGEVYQTAGLYEKAEQEFAKALQLGPTFVDIRLKLAQVLRDQGKTEEAIEQLQRIIKEQPGYINARIHLGVTLYSLGRTSAALAEWQEVLRQDPENRSCQMYMKLIDKPEEK